ncbi:MULTISPECIES: hypothetical protein [unclassified Mesorhizobium]|uniref:hypothetical protein n=1 Tax=unclassified Mesorhizobium TaxID=325217 RepID=UPI0024156A69|nr:MULTISPECIES: hypothetical protein [unclassified Mesorhizobium]MDG4851353.1 hypothetical protein [Mesorhizobium sp. WSM4982]MDG4912631.1 hypothetical protein [Mesorhizobium sp. WSM4983]
MSEFEWPGAPVAMLSNEELDKLQEVLREPSEGHHGGEVARVLSFLGFWHSQTSANLRVLRREGANFVDPATPTPTPINPGDRIALVQRQLYMPDLPHDRCVVQLSYRADHWFAAEKKKDSVAQVTSCHAGEAGTAAALNLPIFDGFQPKDGLHLDLGLYAMADRGSQPILDLLGSPQIAGGLKLIGKYNPAFAMTVPYIQAALAGLTKLSRRNFKLANWQVGFGYPGTSIPLAYGEYLLCDGIIRVGRSSTNLEIGDLKWNAAQQSPSYKAGAFRNPYVMLEIIKSS